MGRWKVWIKEGTWRVLASYDTRKEANRALRELLADGLKAVVCEPGDWLDHAMYQGGPDKGGDGR